MTSNIYRRRRFINPLTPFGWSVTTAIIAAAALVFIRIYVEGPIL